ncbi:MAG TPA: PQQ-dependent sugar dehydrogenase [Actinomycetota bacterium]|nr:PQQ-dependent sugar dehydrogenase [Actinomycetota bacterium]
MVRRILPLLILLLAVPVPARADEAFERVVEGLDFAVNVAFAPDGTMFVADKDRGEIRLVRDGEILDEPFATLPVGVTVNETGLLGIALDPTFPDEPWVYAYYTGADVQNHLVRIRAEGDLGTEVQPLMDLLPATAGWHNGGDIAFGSDGKLYVAVGDGHDASRSQAPDGLGGRILRLNPDGSVPADNPLGANNPTFALGIRNSFGLCFDPATGDLWETENGPDEWDEVNLIRAGGNYGWPLQLGPGGEPTFIAPVLGYVDPIVVTGCAGSPGDGGLYFGEGYTGNLHRMLRPGLGVNRDIPTDLTVARFEGGITDVALSDDGRIWVVTPNALYRSSEVLTSATNPSITGGSGGTGATGASASTTPSASPGSEGGTAGAVTGVGIVVLALLVGGLLFMRSRLLRR